MMANIIEECKKHKGEVEYNDPEDFEKDEPVVMQDEWDQVIYVI